MNWRGNRFWSPHRQPTFRRLLAAFHPDPSRLINPLLRGLRLEALENRELLAIGDFIRTLENPNESAQAFAESGYAFDANEDFLVIGARGADLQGRGNAGEVRIYSRITGQLISVLRAPSVEAAANFGSSVAVFGSTVVVGEPYSNAGASDSGMAYVFDAPSGQLQYTLPNPTPAADELFGISVAISQNWVVVGAPYDSTAAQYAGAAYVFDLQTGTLTHTLLMPAAAVLDLAGSVVRISGDVIAVGVPRDDAGASNAGAAYLFSAVDGTFQRAIYNPTPAANDYFGQSLSISGDFLAVGAHRDDTGVTDAGAAYVFDLNTGGLLHTFVNPAPAAFDNFGYSVSISTNTLVVGAYRDDAYFVNSGTAYQFDLNSGALIRVIDNPTPAVLDYFGAATLVLGDTIYCSAYLDDTAGLDAGAVYQFAALSGQLERTIVAGTRSAYDEFGRSVALQGDHVVVGSYLDDSAALDGGMVYLFDATSGTLLRSLAPPNPAPHENFGFSVAVWGDYLAVGAPGHDLPANDSGVVHIFSLSTGDLLRTLLNPTPAAADRFGSAMSVNANGKLVVGAHYDDVGAVNSGAAYVFDLTSGALLATLKAPVPTADSFFGEALSASTDYVAVGSRMSDALAVDSGEVHLFEAASGAWMRSITNPSPDPQDYFGASLALFGSQLIVGASHDDTKAFNAGAAYVIDVESGAVTRTLWDTNPAPNNQFGYSVAAANNLVIIGATGANSGQSSGGAVHLFLHGEETLFRTLPFTAVMPFDFFGATLAANSRYLAVGATGIDRDTIDRGAVFLFHTWENTPPTARAGGPYSIAEGDLLALDAAGSVDADDPVSALTFEWDLDYDGNEFQVDETGIAPTVNFPDDFPIRMIAVRVTDTGGLSSLATATLEVLNVPPTIGVQVPALSLLEGVTAQNHGSYSDPGQDTVVLSANLGIVTDLGGGQWSWTADTNGLSGSQAVQITVDDGDGGASFVEFSLFVSRLRVASPIVQVIEGASAQNLGEYWTPPSGPWLLSASAGILIDAGGGQWNWTYDSLDGPDDSQTISVTLEHSGGAMEMVTFELIVANRPPQVAVEHSVVSVRDGGIASNTGTWFDVPADLIEITASVGQVEVGANGTWIWSLPTSPGVDDTQIVTITATDSDAAASQITFQLVDLAGIAGIQIGNGAPQRSMVTEVHVLFDTLVDIDPGAFTVTRQGLVPQLVSTVVATQVISGNTEAILTFTGPLTTPGYRSLMNGRYELTVHADKIRRPGSQFSLDGDNDGQAGGNRIFGNAATDAFFRLFGDIDGDGRLTQVDRVALQATMNLQVGQPGFNYLFDHDGDGDVDYLDWNAFFRRRIAQTAELH